MLEGVSGSGLCSAAACCRVSMQMNCGRQLLQKQSPVWAPEEHCRQLQSELCPWQEVPESCRSVVMETLTVSIATTE